MVHFWERGSDAAAVDMVDNIIIFSTSFLCVLF